MLIAQLKHHFPARFPEWVNAGIMATWGAYVLLHPKTLTSGPMASSFSGLASWDFRGLDPAAVWGLTTLLVGVVRAVALFVNGAYSRTPAVRLVASAVSAFVWSQLIVGLVRTGLPNVNVVVYMWLLIIDVASAYRAGNDAAIAEQSRKVAKEAGRVRFVSNSSGGRT